MSKIVTLLLLFAALIAVTPQTKAQSLPLGTLTLLGNDPVACTGVANGSKFYPGMNCLTAQISCPNTANINVTFGFTGPVGAQGTVVFFPGGKGTSPTEDGDEIPTYAASYVKTFEVVQLEYTSSWEDPSSDGSGGNILRRHVGPPHSSTT